MEKFAKTETKVKRKKQFKTKLKLNNISELKSHWTIGLIDAQTRVRVRGLI